MSSSETEMQKINLTENTWVERYMKENLRKKFSFVTYSEVIAELVFYLLVFWFCL